MRKKDPGEKRASGNKLALILGGAGLLIAAVVGLLLSSFRGSGPPAAEQVTLPPLEVNQPAPELTLNSLDGEPVSLKNYHGSVILVNNWATWCPPCRLEMPHFNNYFQKHKERGFQVVAVEAGQPEIEVREFVEELGLDFLVLLDPEGKALEMFQNTSLPSSYVIDRKGNLRLVWLGAINEASLEEYVTPILEE